MRIYKLQISLAIMDTGELEDSPQPEEIQNKMLADPLDRQEKILEKAASLMGNLNFRAAEPGTGNSIRTVETYDVAAQNFTEAMEVIKKFHDLAEKLGVASASGITLPMSVI